jgi:ribonuclease HI
MRNVAGEIQAAMIAVSHALSVGADEIIISHDFTGVAEWPLGRWKTNRAGSVAYAEFMRNCSEKIHITFDKVKGHTGVKGNMIADRLAGEMIEMSGGMDRKKGKE